MKKFLVYKSSAGSGKTFTLMIEYLSLALRYPTAYSRILAITFTNKAANEIKDRILKNLKMLAALNRSGVDAQKEGEAPDGHGSRALDIENLPARDRVIYEQLLKRTGLTGDQLVANADLVLRSVLHHYSDFAVSTIDSFMHKVIRSFAFDLKLSVNFEVELDTGLLINAAVDELIAKVGKDEELTEILENYVVRRAEEEENWDISNDLQTKAGALFKEKMTGLIPLLQNRSLGHSDFVELCKRSSHLKGVIKVAGNEALEILERHGFGKDDLVQGMRGIYGFFCKCAAGEKADAGANVRKALDDGQWLKKGSGLDDRFAVIEPELVAKANTIIETQHDLKFVEIVRDNFHSTLLLKKINDELSFIKEQRNIVSISDFNTLIADVVKDQPVPFIFLRVGEKFRHFMIDEFQDTSEMQWQNLLPLIENALSDSNMNMIVGDGKQAIYRFKNGNAGQFVDLPKLKGSDTSSLVRTRERVLEHQYLEAVLDTNYRSRQEIVEFNNDFFAYAAPVFIPEHAHFYREVRQQFKPDNTGGLVSMNFVEPGLTIEKVLDVVAQARQDGYQYGDIAVLCRVNKDAVRIAEALQSQGIGVVSSESLLLSVSPEVSFLVNWIYWLAFPEDKISLQGVIEYLRTRFLAEEEVLTNRTGRKALTEILVKAGIDLNFRSLAGMSFYDTVELLVRKFELSKVSPVYMRFFLDEVLKFTLRESTGSEGFIEYWQQNCHKLSVSMSDQMESVRILTVHKSKGLDFPVVIYAFPDPRTRKDDLSWQEVSVAVSDEKTLEFPLVYSYGSKLEDTPMQEDYRTEMALNCLDRFNLYYVAFTRASERLYVVMEEAEDKKGGGKKDTEIKLAGLVRSYMDLHRPDMTINRGDEVAVAADGETKGQEYVSGTGDKVKGKYGGESSGKSVDSVRKGVEGTGRMDAGGSVGLEADDRSGFEADGLSPEIDITFIPGDWSDHLVLSGQSPADWVAATTMIGPDAAMLDKTEYGILIHQVLSGIDTAADLAKAIGKAIATLDFKSPVDGNDMFQQQLTGLRERVHGDVQALLSKKEVAKFFKGGNIIKEAEILTPEGRSYRPDRVVVFDDETCVIDYKTGVPKNAHQAQLLTYMQLLSEMGYKNLKGYLFYIGESFEVVKVDFAHPELLLI